MTILLTGGTGKTALPAARLLRDAGYSVLLANRSGNVPSPFKGVAFDWFDATTFENPFNLDSAIDRVYIVLPNTLDWPPEHSLLDIVKPFIDLAISKGVKRFVLLTSRLQKRGMFPLGLVHEYIEDSGVDWAVLRPTWFMDNLSQLHLKSIRENDNIPTVMGDGRVPYIAASDIAELAYRALSDEISHNTDHVVVGPEAYTHDEIAAIFSKTLGRKIEHVRLSAEQGVEFWKTSIGAPEPAAKYIVGVEQLAANGSEYEAFEKPSDGTVFGTTRLGDYIAANRDLWKK